MAMYNFKCDDCGEEFTKITHGNSTTFSCPECKSDDVEKMMPTNIGIRFKGEGYYKTDYKSGEK